MAGSRGSLSWVFFSFQAFCDNYLDSQRTYTAAQIEATCEGASGRSAWLKVSGPTFMDPLFERFLKDHHRGTMLPCQQGLEPLCRRI